MVDGRFRDGLLLWAAIGSREVQRACRTGHHNLSDLIRGRRVDLDPRPLLWLEDFWQTVKTVSSMDASFWFPGNRDVIIFINAFHAGPFAFFSLIVRFVLEFQLASSKNQ